MDREQPEGRRGGVQTKSGRTTAAYAYILAADLEDGRKQQRLKLESGQRKGF